MYLKHKQPPSSDTTSDLSQLEQQIASLTNEQYDEMTKAIKSFCKNYPLIRDAVRHRSETKKGAGGTGYPEMTVEDERKLQEQLLNVIRVNLPTPSPESQPNNEDSN
jgi:cell division septum initiation protein DivIVA